MKGTYKKFDVSQLSNRVIQETGILDYVSKLALELTPFLAIQ